MGDDLIVNSVQSINTEVLGRTLNSAGVHHFIIDGPSEPNEEIVSIEAFLAGISSCAVHLIEGFAREEGVQLNRVSVDINAVRRKETPQQFESINLLIDLTGPDRRQGENLVERFKGR